MYDKKLENMLNEMKNLVRPRRMFAVKMRLRLELKSWNLFWQRSLHQYKLKVAGAVSFIILTLTGSVGAYAFSSPDVNVLHPLYPIKQTIENAELYLAVTPHTKAQVHLKHALKRMQEAEVLAEKLNYSGTSSIEEKGVDDTLVEMQTNLDLSMNKAAEEENSTEANITLNLLQSDFKSVQERLDKLEKRNNLKKHILIRTNFNQIKNSTENKLEKVEQVSNEVKQAVKEKKDKVFLKKLNKKEETKSPEKELHQQSKLDSQKKKLQSKRSESK